MTRHFARKVHTLSFVALFVAIVTILAGLASLAQIRDAGRASVESPAVGAPTGAVTFAQALERPPLWAVSSVRRASATRSQTKKPAAEPDTRSVSFLPAVTYGTPYGVANAVAVADLTGHGKLDVTVADLETLDVFLGNGDGTLQSVILTSSPLGTNDIALAVLNGERPDAVISFGSDAGVLLGDGDGNFQHFVEYPAGGTGANSVAVADLNGDGKPDIVMANGIAASGGDGAIGVLLGNGDGAFKPTVSYDSGGENAISVAIADVNGDGKPDVLVANVCASDSSCSSGVIAVLLGNGDGTFRTATAYGTGGAGGTNGYGTSGETLAVADVNGDGKPDLVVVNSQSNTVGVLLGNGDGTFQSAVTYSTGGTYPDAVAISDLNGDYQPDLIVVNQTEGTLGVLLGNGDGTFQAAVTFSTGGAAPVSIVAGDLNGDGKPDLVVANANDPGTVGVLLNTSTFGSPTTTTITSSRNPSNYKQTVTFTAAVSSASGIPTGTVIFYDGPYGGPTSLGSATLANGSASLSTSALPAGSHSITAVYQGSPTFARSVSAGLDQVVKGTTTTTSLASSLNNIVYGQSVTFTAEVTSASGTPIGNVVFYDGSTLLGSAALASGSATLATTSVAAGSRSITAAYQGSGRFEPSTSAPLSESVQTATTTTVLVSSLNPAPTRQPFTLTATVIGQYGGVATGTISFYDGHQNFSNIPLNDNQAVYDHGGYRYPGDYSLSATYSGDANNVGSASPVLVEEVDPSHVETFTQVTTSGSPSLVGKPVTFNAAVTSPTRYGSPGPGEVVTFYDGKTMIGSATTIVTRTASVATFTTSSLTAKTHAIKAIYPGDDEFLRSSGEVMQVVDKYATTTALLSSLNPAVFGQPITYTATVTPSGPSIPTGKVRLTNVGLVPLVGGVATITKTQVKAGAYAITAEYLGDGVSAPSTSPVLNEVVNQAPTTTVLTSSANPSKSGQTVTFTATVTSSTGLAPVGKVTFADGTTTLKTVTLSNAKASIATATLPVGLTTITATYSGAPGFIGSSASLTQKVQP